MITRNPIHTTAIASALGASAVLISLEAGQYPLASIVVAALGAAVAGLARRSVSLVTGLILATILLWGRGPIVIVDLMLAALLLWEGGVRPLPTPRLNRFAWSLLSIQGALALGVAIILPAGLPRSIMICGTAMVALAAGRALAIQAWTQARSAGPRRKLRHADLTATTRALLLGRIAGGITHELSQSLNVITMANGNLGYIVDRIELPGVQGEQISERVRKIALHADTAAQTLSLLRLFGKDGAGDRRDLTVGSALEQAIEATRAPARKIGVTIEARGDALDHPVLLRHGTIELMATASLLELFEQLAVGRVAGANLLAIVFEATRTQSDIEISVICQAPRLPAAEVDEIGEASMQLVRKLATSCRSEIRAVADAGTDVRFLLRLSRDVV